MDVVTIGETMVLFTPSETGLMRYSPMYSRKYGGAETNFAIGLSRLGHRVGWISRVGNDEFGKSMLGFIRGEGIDVSQVKVDKEAPTGIYFKELRTANDVRVYYYRKDSAASKMTKHDVDEEYIKKAKYLFLTGITPALSESCKETVYEAIEIAKRNNVEIIFDPNLRKKLWPEEVARNVLLDIVSKVDIVLPGISEGQFLFQEDKPERLGELFLNLGPSKVIIKLGEKGAYYATREHSEYVPGFKVEQVIDPVGAGDGFAAGFVSGLLEGLTMKEAVKKGNAIGAMVTMVNGDVEGLPEIEDLHQFMNNLANDNVNR